MTDRIKILTTWKWRLNRWRLRSENHSCKEISELTIRVLVSWAMRPYSKSWPKVLRGLTVLWGQSRSPWARKSLFCATWQILKFKGARNMPHELEHRLKIWPLRHKSKKTDGKMIQLRQYSRQRASGSTWPQDEDEEPFFKLGSGAETWHEKVTLVRS